MVYDAIPETIVHVIGRTKPPRRYFYRKRTSQGWSPWEKMDVDIQGDHVLPITHLGKLYVFWATIEDKAKPKDSTSADAPAGTSPLDDDVKTDATLTAGQQPLNQPAVPTEEDGQRPTPIVSTISLTVAEHRDGVWSASEASKAQVTLDISPVRHALSFYANTSKKRIAVSALANNHVVAKFNYDLGTSAIVGERRCRLSDDSGQYPSGLRHFTFEPQDPGLTITGPGKRWFQDYLPDGKMRVYLNNGGDPIPQATLLDTLEPDSRVICNRGKEPAKERPHLVLQDRRRSFFVTVKSRPVVASGKTFMTSLLVEENGQEAVIDTAQDKDIRFEPFFHPYVADFRQRLAISGLDGLLRAADQSDAPQAQSNDISSTYGVTLFNPYLSSFPRETVDFRLGAPYSIYNWELFFHAPFLIANRLSQQGQYREARDWYHAIFDPTDGTPPPGTNQHVRYWKFKPFADNKDLASIQDELAGSVTTAYGEEMLAWADHENESIGSDTLAAQIRAYREDPFDPHALAALRPVAYQKAVVQKYIENLIAWGDQLFSQDSIESVNEATQLYINALQILGPKPTIIPKPIKDAAQSYEQLDATSAFDAFSNALVDVEVIVPRLPKDGFKCKGGPPVPATIYGSPYFCIPSNEKLLGLWDIVADRLFKIRHCQNIQGIVRELPLFQPPIDPALLVRARAAGLDLSSVLNDLSVAAPPYRYSILAARASEYVSAVITLGGALLSALEKQDAEHLAQLRAGHEVANQELTREIRRTQLTEAKENLEATRRSLTLAQARRDYYEGREFMNAGEIEAQDLGQTAEDLSIAANVLKVTASGIALIPDAFTGVAGIGASPVGVLMFGATNFVRAALHAGEALSEASRAVGFASSAAATTAGYERRMDDWRFQARQAKFEIAQIEKQVVAAEIRVAMAEQELALLEQQLQQSKEVERHLRTKFTNEELYGWMQGQLQAVYYQAYRLAFDMARRAEKAFRFERADDTQTFINFGSWEGQRQGLLAGERLASELRTMDAAYHSQNKREYELTKTIPISQLDPDAFMALRSGATSSAAFSLSEVLFDEDFPTHHLRRIKSANISLQCTPGPYQSVMGRLDLLRAQTRTSATADTVTEWTGVVSSVATSTAQNDTGLFELSFRDERYLPFEGAGAHHDGAGPQWRFTLTPGNELSYDSISELVLQLRYTAREGRAAYGPGVLPRKTLWRIPDSATEAYQAFLDGLSTTIDLPVGLGLLPKAHGRTVSSITGIKVYARWSSGTGQTVGITTPAGSALTISGPTALGAYQTFTASTSFNMAPQPANVTWKFAPTRAALDDFWVSFTYNT